MPKGTTSRPLNRAQRTMDSTGYKMPLPGEVGPGTRDAKKKKATRQSNAAKEQGTAQAMRFSNAATYNAFKGKEGNARMLDGSGERVRKPVPQVRDRNKPKPSPATAPKGSSRAAARKK